LLLSFSSDAPFAAGDATWSYPATFCQVFAAPSELLLRCTSSSSSMTQRRRGACRVPWLQLGINPIAMGAQMAVLYKAQHNSCLNWLPKVLYSCLLPKTLLTRTMKLSLHFAHLLKMCITFATES